MRAPPRAPVHDAVLAAADLPAEAREAVEQVVVEGGGLEAELGKARRHRLADLTLALFVPLQALLEPV